MAGGVAEQLRIEDRGLVLEGMVADLVCFDSDTVIDTVTFDAPPEHQLVLLTS